MDLQLGGKTALVTGSSKGIGEAIARMLAREGATVIVHGRDRALTQAVADDIVSSGGRACAVFGDLTDDREVQGLIEDAEQFCGAIDILVNNAGGSGRDKESWLDARPATWASAYDRNVLAAVRVTTPLLARMKQKRWGRIINISSLAATMPPPTAPDYAACKAAINAMTASMAKALAADGITVNAVSPGTIHSATLDARFREAAAERKLAHRDAPGKRSKRLSCRCLPRSRSGGSGSSTTSRMPSLSSPAPWPDTLPAPICASTGDCLRIFRVQAEAEARVSTAR